MTKTVANQVLDPAHEHLRDNCDLLVICEGDPADYNAAVTLKSGAGARIASVAMAPGNFAIADGTPSGREIRMAAVAAVTAEESGNGAHGCWLDTTNNVLLRKTSLVSAITVTAGVDFPVGEFVATILDPT